MKRAMFELIDKQEFIERAAPAMETMSHPARLKVPRDRNVLGAWKDVNRVCDRVGDEHPLQLIGTMREVLCGESRA